MLITLDVCILLLTKEWLKMLEDNTFDELNIIATKLALNNEWNDVAIEVNKKMIEKKSNFSVAYTRLAKCLLVKGDHQGAYEIYEKVLEFDPENKISLNFIKSIEISLKEEKQREEYDAKIARELEEERRKVAQFKDMISKINNYEEAYLLGKTKKDAGEYNYAIYILNRSLEINPNYIKARNTLAACYRAVGKLELAKEIYLDNLQNDNRFVAHIGLAAVLRDSFELQEAKRIYQFVLSKSNDNIYALHGIGAVYSDLKEYALAEKAFIKAAQLELSYGRSKVSSIYKLLNLKQLYIKNNDYDGISRIDEYIRQFRI